MKLSLIIEAIARGRGIDQTRRAMGGLDRDAKRAAGGIRQADRAMGRAERSADRLSRAGYRIGQGIGAGARRAIGGLAALGRRLTITQAQAAKLAYWTGTKIGRGLRWGVGAAATAAAGGLLASTYKVVSAGLQFEKYRTQLRGLEGSAAAGQRAMDWVTNFARTTPYELDEVMDAFIALKAYGIDPTDGTLRILGDTAAGMGKRLSQAVEMIADAQTGEFERLKEFGIRAKVAGDRVTFSYVRNGKQMTQVARNNAAAIQRALGDIFGMRFAGGMDRLSKTTEGKWSGLMDRMTISAARVWDGGIGASVNRMFDSIDARIEQAEKDGSLKKWTEDVGKGVGGMIDAFAEADWKAIGADIKSVGEAFGYAAKGARALVWAMERLGELRGAIPTAPGSWTSGSKWSGSLVSPMTGGIISAIVRGKAYAGSAAPTPPAPQPKPPVRWPKASPYQGPFLGAPTPAFRRPAPPAVSQLKGHISLDIRTDRGTSVKPIKMSADPGLGVSLDTGRSMASTVA